MITQTTTQKNVTMAVVTAFGLIIAALKMATGKSVTEQQQIWSSVLAVAVLATTTTMAKKSIVVVILKQSLLMSC